MQTFSGKFYKIENNDYNERLYKPGTISSQFEDLFKYCFTHHVIDSDNYKSDSLECVYSGHAERRVNYDNLVSFFHEKLYSPPDFFLDFRGREDNKDGMNYEEFFKRVTDKPSVSVKSAEEVQTGSNNISFLVGEVGDGKTILVSHMVFDIWKRNKRICKAPSESDSKDKSIIVPVRINIDYVFRNGRELLPLKDNLYKKIANMLYHEITNRSWLKQKAEFDKFLVSPTSGPVNYIIKLSHHLASRNIRIFIAIDNLDRYHFRSMRESFFKRSYKKQIKDVFKNINNTVMDFGRDGETDLKNAGLCVLFVCRRSVYEFVSMHDAAAYPDYGVSVYYIGKTTIFKALDSRFKLFSEAVAVCKLDSFKIPMSELGSALDHKDNVWTGFGSPVMDLICKLSHHGLRSFFSFVLDLGTLGVVGHPHVFKRLFKEQPRLCILMYLLNSRKRYSHAVKFFPNLFLNDAKKWPGHSESYIDHLHTYWLKFFLLNYIQQFNEVTVDQIVSVFCDHYGYEKHLVLIVLGSLCSSNEYRCASVKYDSTGIINNNVIYISERGKALIGEDPFSDNSFCFSFTYLQLAVEDPFLSIPWRYAGSFSCKYDYSYILSVDDSEYGKSAKLMTISKSKSVTLFYWILRASLEAEFKHRPNNMYDGFRSFYPDMEKIGVNLYREVNGLLKFFNERELVFDSAENKSLLEELTGFYDEYYCSGSI
ncbi:MAG: hypothetical protein HQL95_06010 [Magnetococcales bacterium]|nr:hypothetical protein [Magnetococcales bacterium]